MGGCRAGLRERRFVSPAPTPPPLSPPPPPLPFVPLYLRSGVPSAFAGGIGAVGSRRWGSRLSLSSTPRIADEVRTKTARSNFRFSKRDADTGPLKALRL